MGLSSHGPEGPQSPGTPPVCDRRRIGTPNATGQPATPDRCDAYSVAAGEWALLDVIAAGVAGCCASLVMSAERRS